MPKVKPAGITLRVWREVEEQQQKKIHKIKKPLQKQAELDRLAEEHTVVEAQRAAEAAELAKLFPPKKGPRAPCGPQPGSKLVQLKGELDGWTEEKRTTGNGRKYVVFHSPAGQMFMSRVAALRSIGVFQ